MQSIEPRNEQLMLRQFWKKHPTYNLNAMMRRRYEELMDAKAFSFSRTEKSQQAVPTKQAVWPGSSTTAAYIGPPQD